MARAIAWKLYYLTLEAEWTYRTLAGVLSVVARLAGRSRASAILEAMAARTVWAGWPRNARGWINVSASALCWRLRRRLDGSAPQVAPRPPHVAAGPLRVGCFGPFSGLLSFPPGFFSCAPRSIHLSVYDVRYREAFAPPAPGTVSQYHPITPDSSGAWLDQTADAINRAGLDVLLNIGSKADGYR